MKNTRPHLILAVILGLALGACATTPVPGKPDTAGDPVVATANRVAEAVTSPLADFNVLRTQVAASLTKAMQDPYAAPTDMGCTTLAQEVQLLDTALGPDVDAPPTKNNPDLIEQGGVAVQDAAIGAIKGAAEGIIPFRNWVRKLSGAEAHSREVADAVAAGIVRRAYLKGLGQAQSCGVPAAPYKAKPVASKT